MKLYLYNDDEITEIINSDDTIYHYTSSTTAIEYILKNKKLQLNSFSKTDDPQDSFDIMPRTCGYGDSSNYNTQMKIAGRKISEIKDSALFTSFFQTKKDDLNLRMFSQYGDKHKGVCLAFSKEKLLEEINQVCKESFTIYSDFVTYEHPTKHTLYHDESSNQRDNGLIIANQYIKQNSKQIFFQKSPDYKDESEFRIVIVNKNGESISNKFIDISSSLKMIIIGHSFSDVYQPTISALSKSFSIPYRKLFLKAGGYGLRSWEE